MAAGVKFQVFISDLLNKVHDILGTAGSTADTLKVYLTDATPNAATNAVKGDLADITNHNGYAGAVTTANVGAAAAGVVTLTGTTVTIVASGGTIGPFRYVVLYNSTAGTVPLVAYWDYGVELTLADGDSFVIKFNGGTSSGTIATFQ